MSLANFFTDYFGSCPDCFWTNDEAENAKCGCGHQSALTLVTTSEWRYGDGEIQAFSKYDGLRLMGGYRGKKPELLACYQHLQYLYLSSYKGFSFAHLYGFTRLRELELDYTSIRDLKGVGNATGLDFLSLTECRLLADLGGLAEIPHLRFLSLALCNRVKDYSPLEELCNLEDLFIEAHVLPSLDFLKPLKKLRRLILSVGRVLNPEPPELSGLAGLREVFLPKKRWTRQLVESVKKDMPACSVEIQ